MLKDQFVGTWALIRTEFHGSDGELVYPYGKEPSGVVIYDADGHMAVQIMGSDRPTFASDDEQNGTFDELKAAFEKYGAYFGTYTVDEAQGRVIHHVQGSLFPNWVGGDQVRYFQFDGNRLTLRTPPILDGGSNLTGTLVWERLTLAQS
jgi:hypothetical protein